MTTSAFDHFLDYFLENVSGDGVFFPYEHRQDVNNKVKIEDVKPTSIDDLEAEIAVFHKLLGHRKYDKKNPLESQRNYNQSLRMLLRISGMNSSLHRVVTTSVKDFNNYERPRRKYSPVQKSMNDFFGKGILQRATFSVDTYLKEAHSHEEIVAGCEAGIKDKNMALIKEYKKADMPRIARLFYVRGNHEAAFDYLIIDHESGQGNSYSFYNACMCALQMEHPSKDALFKKAISHYQNLKPSSEGQIYHTSIRNLERLFEKG